MSRQKIQLEQNSIKNCPRGKNLNEQINDPVNEHTEKESQSWSKLNYILVSLGTFINLRWKDLLN